MHKNSRGTKSGKTINRPAYNNSCSNLLTHAGQCLRKQQEGSGHRTLASVGVTGTGNIDPREICGIVADNAANNKTMMDDQGNTPTVWTFKEKVACNNPDPNEPDETNKEEEPENFVTNLDEEENSTNSEDEEDLIGSSEDLDESNELTITDIDDLENEGDDNMYTTSLCRRTLAKFCAIATKLKKSPNSKAKFIKLCRENNCNKPHNVERDVPTHWNSTYKQILSVVRCKKAILLWQRNKQYGTTQRFHLNEGNIDLAKHLFQVLKPFYKFNLQVSTKTSAQVAEGPFGARAVSCEYLAGPAKLKILARYSISFLEILAKPK
ncbi:hypothetical protein PCASD_23433, partial [Puccinia coronata f. sp. avenae]